MFVPSAGGYDASARAPAGQDRAVTDRETFAWICDVMIDPDYRGRGLGQFLMRCVIEHPSVRHVRMILGTQTVHTFYEKFGFERRELMRRPAPLRDPIC